MRRSTREEEMTEALLDIANEFNFAPDDDITEDTRSVDQEGLMRCLRSCNKSFIIIQFTCQAHAFEGHV